MWGALSVASPLEGSLARTIGAAFGNLFLTATLSRDVSPDSPAYDAFDPPAPVTQTYACKAIVEKYSDYYRSNGLVDARDRKVLILATSLAVTPQPDDRVTIQGVTFVLSEIATDPARAVLECKGRL